MTVTVQAIVAGFAAEIGDADLSRPLSGTQLATIDAAFAEHPVLIFPGQELTHAQHLAFSRHFGPHETSIGVHRSDTRLRLRAELADVSNLAADGRIWDADSRLRMFQLGNRLWHTDSSFRHVPARASVLYARSIAPIGGHTEFADLRAAYDALPEHEKQQFESLRLEHSIFHSRARLGFVNFTDEERAALPPVYQRLVRTIPESGRRSLYLASHAGRVEGIDDAQGRALIDRLIAFATQRQFVYTHRWRTHDLVIWDNRCTMHRGTEFDDMRWRRDMQRSSVADIGNTCEIAEAAAETAGSLD